MNIVIAGGGTGGHLFPGIAVAEELARRGSRVRFMGSEHGIERTAVAKAGFEVDLLPVRGLRRTGLAAMAQTLVAVPKSIFRAWRLLRGARTDLVIGVGGYASFPASVAAILSRRPLVLLEQNAEPGLTTRLLSPFARRICVSFAETLRHLPRRRAVVTGNPTRGTLRKSLLAPRQAVSPNGSLRLLVFGGSAGAHRLNLVVPEALRVTGELVEVLHQTGSADLEAVRSAYAAISDGSLRAEVTPFIDDMAGAYSGADLVVCRSGATTLAELTSLGIPAILVPYPYAAGDHQRRNAEALVEAGAALMILDAELTPQRLATELTRLCRDRGTLQEMGEKARGLGRPEAAERVVEECLAVLAGV